MSTGLVGKVTEIASEIAEREGCLLYDIEFLEAGRILRVFIDKDPNGASLDDCVNVSRGLNLALDVEDIVPGGHYDLEVSTPGLERKLTQDWHFTKALGQMVQLKFEGEDGKNRTVKGELKEVDSDRLVLEEGKSVVQVPLSKILKAKTVFGGVKKAPKKPKKR